MNIENILITLSAVVTLLGGSNIYTLWLLFKTRQADIDKTEALSGQEIQKEIQEKANSVTKSQDILDRLTVQMELRFVEMYKTIGEQNKTISDQNKTIAEQNITISNQSVIIQNLQKLVNMSKK